ncbi:MAG: hypothetical protein UY90_C0059G0003 [Candidatus Peregrinibacteria bacterium GW2011_GWA2_54_9]|nr:MAG: hypothetical protein UY90_C0059G0003 [Candidatus Peregrinibacteria bacterium GW2011_GWA2_54_9]
MGVDTPQEENGDRVDHPEDGEPPKPAELPRFLGFHAPVAFKDGLNLLLRGVHGVQSTLPDM